MSELEYSTNSDEILGALARADELLEEGLGIEATCRYLGIQPERYHLWRRAHSRTFLATARQLEVLEQVHVRLLALLTQQQEEIHRLERLLRRSSSRLSAAG